MSDIDEVVAAISEQRLWRRLMEMATHGGTAGGGVNRPAASAEDAAAQRQLMLWASARGFLSFRDEIGNLFIRRPGTDAAAAPVVIGSHLDSQPTGGKFDGAYGVLAAFEVLEAVADAGIATRCPIEVVSWTNEEGSRFQPGAMGSAVFAGSSALDVILARTDGGGLRLGDELAKVAALAPAPFRAMAEVARPTAYLEAHIEQGPLLELSGTPIGVVGGIQGIRRFRVDVAGEEAHAGTTPRHLRKDALVAAMAAITALNRAADDVGEALRFTVGSMAVLPNSPNTVPGAVRFTIDLRHPDDATLSAFEGAIHASVEQSVQLHRCSAGIERLTQIPPTAFDPSLLDALRDAAERLDYRHQDINSGAGHDALHLARICPTAMIFIPCWKGISHNEAESVEPGDAVAGARVLAAATMRLAERGGPSRQA